MAAARIAVVEEVGRTRTFLWALEWPGWCRGARNRALLPGALLAHLPRYARVAAEAGLAFLPATRNLTDVDLVLVESVPGGGGTDFGVPSAISPLDRRSIAADEADRLARLVEAAWILFDRTAASAPLELRRGPRGGGRDRDRMVGHVVGADHAYARELGLRGRPPSATDRAAIEDERAAMLEILRRPSDGSALAGRTWTARYAARRIAWHALDHAWEIEDRTEPGG